MEQEKVNTEAAPIKNKAKLSPVFDMFEESCKVYAKNIKKFVEIYLRGLVGAIPLFAVMILFILLSMVEFLGASTVFKAIFIILFIITAAWAIYYSVRVRAAMILLIKNDYSSAKSSFEQSKKYFWGYIVLSLVGTLIIGLWTLLLIIPGIIFAIYFALINYTFFFEDFKGYTALKRSKELVKGYWWAVTGRLLFIGLLAGIVNFILAIPMAALEEGSAGYGVYNVFINVVWALIAPVIIIYTYYIFRDLKKIKGESKFSVVKK